MVPRPRPPTERQRLYDIFLRCRKEKNELKQELKIFKEYLLPKFQSSPSSSSINASIIHTEQLIAQLEKMEYTVQMRSELLVIRGRI